MIRISYKYGNYNFVGEDGRLASHFGFTDATGPVDGMSVVETGLRFGIYNVVRGQYILPPIYKSITRHPHGRLLVEDVNGKLNIVNKDGNLVSPVWFDEIYTSLDRKYIRVEVANDDERLVNYISDTLISDTWFTAGEDFDSDSEDAHAMVANEGVTMCLDTYGNLWDSADDENMNDAYFRTSEAIHQIPVCASIEGMHPVVMVEDGFELYTFLKNEDKSVVGVHDPAHKATLTWFDDMKEVDRYTFVVMKNGEHNILTALNGNISLVSPVWFDSVNYEGNGEFTVVVGARTSKIDINYLP